MTPEPAGLWTIPNVLSAGRLVGSPVLVATAAAGWADVSLGLFLLLWLSDWLDGKLAVRLKQQTAFGARLDSAADAAFYAATAAAVALLAWDVVRAEAAWIGSAVGSYLVSVGAGVVRFRRVPSYHTRMAKTSWLLTGAAAVAALAGGPAWPVRVAAAAVALTNLEATAITFLIRKPVVDVPSVVHALRRDRRLPLEDEDREHVEHE